MSEPQKKSPWPPARIALVTILAGFGLYALTTLIS
jgi:hypothetical protein